MTNSQSVRLSIIVLFTLLLLVTPNTVAQSCSSGGGFGGPVGGGNLGLFCNIEPTDIFAFAGNLTVTCVGCVQGGSTPFPHSPGFSHGGTQSCTRFAKDVVINFSQPVANVWFEVFGARRVTDNLGHSYYLDPPLDANGAPQFYVPVFISGR